ncbi:MAG: HEAT repeat domain-containing protein [Nitrospiraceae bacterium]|nr:HEAT repeat domain-containing protein [Nitrospiraceae bacterium]
MNDIEMRDMLIDYMGRGFLENIIALFKQEPGLARHIPDMLSDTNVGVRLGTTALIEDLAGGFSHAIRDALPGLIALLSHENPTVRGDAAYVLGVMKEPSARDALLFLREDPNGDVREIVREALDALP